MEHMSREDLNLIIASRMESDPAFRDQLLADPRGVVSEISGMELPEYFKITVHEESLTDIHLVVAPGAGALNDDDLELVAGGYAWEGSCAGCSL